MIDLLIIQIIINIFYVWSTFLILCIITTTIIGYLLLKTSKEPEELIHKPYTDEDTFPGLLNELSQNLKDEKKLNQYKTEIKDTMIIMFFQKIEEKEKIPIKELIEMKKNNSPELLQLIGDEEIYNFIQNFDENKTNKQKYLKEIKEILDKMEAWR